MANVARPWLTGKPKLDPAVRRDKKINICMTATEFENVHMLSEMYHMKPSILLYKLMANKLQEEGEAIQAYRKVKSSLKGV